MSETTTIIAAVPGEQPASVRPISPWRRALVWIVVPGLVAAGTVALAAADRGAPETRGGAAARFVPPDGYAALVTGDDGTREIHESARDTGPSLLLELPRLAAGTQFSALSEDTLRTAQLWRETVTSLDDDPQITTTYLLDEQGISTVAVTGGTVGFSYSPPLVTLPADAAPGVRWTGAGAAMPANLLDYRTTGEITAGEHGCLVATTETLYSKPGAAEVLLRVAEAATWCPGRGVVADDGVVNDTAVSFRSQELAATGAGITRVSTSEAQRDWSGASGWRGSPLAFRLVDPVYGESELGLPLDGLLAATSSGRIVASMTGRLQSFVVEGGTATRDWVAAPGGDPLALSTAGELTLVSTSERRLLAYDERGRRLWSLEFPDVVLAHPVAVGDDLVVVSLDGTLRRIHAATGETVWSIGLRTDVDETPAIADGAIVVVDRGGTVRAHELTDGSERWSVELTGAMRAVSGAGLVVVQAQVSDVWALDPADGATHWHAVQRGVARGLVVAGDLVVTQSDEGSAARDAVTGEPRWTDAAGEALFTDGARIVLIGARSVDVRGRDGEPLSHTTIEEVQLGATRLYLDGSAGIRVIETTGTGLVVGG